MAAANVPPENAPAPNPPVRHDKKTGVYSCQLDEQTFELNVEGTQRILVAGLTCTPMISISLGELSYLLSICASREKPSEFIHVIDSFIIDKMKLSLPITDKKKEPKTLLIPYVHFTKLIIFYLRTLHPFHPRTRMPIPDALITDDIRNAPDYSNYLELLTKHDRRVGAEAAKPSTLKTKPAKVTKQKTTMKPAPKASKPKTTSSQPPKPKPSSTKPSKGVPEKKCKLVKETPDEPSPAKISKGGLVGKRCKPKSPLKLVDKFADVDVPTTEPRIVDEEADFQRGIELSLKDLEARNHARTVVAHTFLDLNTLKKKSVAYQYILQKHTPKTVKPMGSTSQPKDEGITMTNSETESGEIVTRVNKEKDASNRELTKINTGVQDEGWAGSNPGKQDKGQARSNPEKDASNRELTKINTGVQDEGWAGSNPGKQDKGQARSNPGNAALFQP
nr:hypothetical protein [Tanacetum cinerariifolium]